MKGHCKGGCAPLAARVVEGGGVATPQGFVAAGVHAGFRAQGDRLDCALVAADEPCTCAGVFSQSSFCAAPVTVSRSHLHGVSFGTARAVLVNSGNANAATGPQGIDVAERSAALVARELGCRDDEVLVASTGTIGVPLSLEPFERGVPLACRTASRAGGREAARAIMTTDTRPKEFAIEYASTDPAYEGCAFTIGGMAKGAGMIMPRMATMIAVLTTDVPVVPNAAYAALKRAADISFNKVTIDSDTSTNDSCFLFASGKKRSRRLGGRLVRDGVAYEEFATALETVCVNLARQIAADGEGATKLITVNVAGAFDDRDADAVARVVANSPLVKTAVFGRDANWGRIAAALGHSGAIFRACDVAIDIVGLPVCRGGCSVPFDEDEALRRFEGAEICIDINLGAGNHEATLWSCDLTPDYATINGSYRS